MKRHLAVVTEPVPAAPYVGYTEWSISFVKAMRGPPTTPHAQPAPVRLSDKTQARLLAVAVYGVGR